MNTLTLAASKYLLYSSSRYSSYDDDETNIFLLLVELAVIILILIGWILASGNFAEAARLKGYPSEGVAVKCFFFGIPYMLSIIALPDRGTEKNQGVTGTVENGLQQGLGVWKCPGCGKENKNSGMYCTSCGASKPQTTSIFKNLQPAAPVKAGGQNTAAANSGPKVWRCPNCGKPNKSTNAVCSCGTPKQ